MTNPILSHIPSIRMCLHNIRETSPGLFQVVCSGPFGQVMLYNVPEDIKLGHFMVMGYVVGLSQVGIEEDDPLPHKDDIDLHNGELWHDKITFDLHLSDGGQFDVTVKLDTLLGRFYNQARQAVEEYNTRGTKVMAFQTRRRQEYE